MENYYYDVIIYANTHQIVYNCCVNAENETVAEIIVRTYFKKELMCFRTHRIVKRCYDKNKKYLTISIDNIKQK